MHTKDMQCVLSATEFAPLVFDAQQQLLPSYQGYLTAFKISTTSHAHNVA